MTQMTQIKGPKSFVVAVALVALAAGRREDARALAEKAARYGPVDAALLAALARGR